MFSRLASKLERLFPYEVRSRGQSYYSRGFVRIQRGSARSLDAVVSGSQAYEVGLEWDDGELSLYCDCPYFESDGPCEHLWAAVLAAEARGYLSKVPANPPVSEIGPEELLDEFDGELSLFPLHAVSRKSAVRLPPVAKPPAWKTRIAGVGADKTVPSRGEWPDKREILYVVDLAASVAAGGLVLALCTRDRKLNGTFSRMVALKLPRGQVLFLPLAGDREILSAILGGSQYYGYGGLGDSQSGAVPVTSLIPPPLSGAVVPLAARTGRCYLRRNTASEDLEPLIWDEGGAWRFELELRAGEKTKRGQAWLVTGVLRREDETLEVSAPALVTLGGHVFTRGMVAPLAEDTRFDWLLHLRRNGGIEVPAEDRDELLATLLCTPGVPKLEVPEELRYEEVTLRPQPCLRLREEGRFHGNATLVAELSFDYDGRLVPAHEKSSGFYDAAGRRLVRRDADAERAATDLLKEVGVKFRPANWQNPEPGWELAPARLQRVVRALVEAGWHLDADGKVFRPPGALRMEVSSGVDWFELHGEVEYGETSARLPELLEALRRGENMVKLGDGTYGVLPGDWLRRIGMLAGMGTPEAGHIRFRPSQAGLLDALLAAQPEAKFDERFAVIRDELRRFQGVSAVAQPEGFIGHLRDYQREGVGWMEFLRRFSFGGCLADDMGVGKTAQVLALLESRRELRRNGKLPGPSLVVAPRSLIFNWKQEAERFTPQLRVLDYTGLNRGESDFSGYDLILTTYGTLRRDAARLKDLRFDYVVLDEAQAVKNASTESAKAVRLLSGDHRLALSGTPVENHLGELWSLFEFLNPGMLGAASVFQLTSAPGRAGRTVDADTRQILRDALRPFILRRTKEQVVRELPAKTEQTLYCELEPVQRKLYDELRQHYRDSLLQKIQKEGLAKSKIMVLEALLRLRQAACHPGLIDVKRSGEPSAKLEALREQLREVLGAGHKALVFSQFTSLLKILRNRLDSEGVVYEYLDGKTRDRQAHVERFQNDADCKLFLVSLKAGGLGLNLTAADYVFLLDPWWNPAVEAQAVDRAHRIGQTRAVFAYRLIARDTVEEKVLELQKTKRDLAAAIIGEDNALIRDLRREDLELLLS
jgi:superfamily II DNA or RNA helicase